jgi:flagellar hook assembly protein FlgD
MPTEFRFLDVAGRVVRSVEMGSLPAGRHTFEWDGTDAAGRSVASGLYFIRFEAGRIVRSTTLLRLR